MTQLSRLILMAALASLSACDSEGLDENNIVRASDCDFTPSGDIEIAFDGELRITDIESELELYGDVCLLEDAHIFKGKGVTLAADGSPSFTADPRGSAFACSCIDVSGVLWTQACADPPHYGCSECCDANGGDSTKIKIKPPCHPGADGGICP